MRRERALFDAQVRSRVLTEVGKVSRRSIVHTSQYNTTQRSRPTAPMPLCSPALSTNWMHKSVMSVYIAVFVNVPSESKKMTPSIIASTRSPLSLLYINSTTYPHELVSQFQIPSPYSFTRIKLPIVRLPRSSQCPPFRTPGPSPCLVSVYLSTGHPRRHIMIRC